MTGDDVVLEVRDLGGTIVRNVEAAAIDTRVALGLPVDQPVVAAGHQAALHHGGLIAKDMVASASARRCGGVAAHLLLDTAVDGVFDAVVPRCERGRWRGVRAFEVQEARGPLWRRPAARIEAMAIDCDAALQGSAVDQAAALMGWQWARLGLDPHVIRASSLLDTPAWALTLEAMRRDPARCARTLANAIENEGVNDMRRPELGPDPQLPLWVSSCDDPASRRMARASDLDRSGVVLEPRAVVTSSIMRRFVCDRWVHGVGGDHYDRATVRWMRSWLDIDLPKATFATAHVRLDAAAWAQAQRRVGEARLGLRRARHDPSGGAPSPAKADMLQAIDAAPGGSADRRRAFRSMHERLQAQAADRIAPARAALEEAIGDAQVLQRRDWPLLALPPERAAALATAVESAVGG